MALLEPSCARCLRSGAKGKADVDLLNGYPIGFNGRIGRRGIGRHRQQRQRDRCGKVDGVYFSLPLSGWGCIRFNDESGIFRGESRLNTAQVCLVSDAYGETVVEGAGFEPA